MQTAWWVGVHELQPFELCAWAGDVACLEIQQGLRFPLCLPPALLGPGLGWGEGCWGKGKEEPAQAEVSRGGGGPCFPKASGRELDQAELGVLRTRALLGLGQFMWGVTCLNLASCADGVS